MAGIHPPTGWGSHLRLWIPIFVALAALACSGGVRVQRVVEVSPNLPGNGETETWDGAFEPDGACPAPTFAVPIDCDGSLTCVDESGAVTVFPPVCPPTVLPPPAGDADD